MTFNYGDSCLCFEVIARSEKDLGNTVSLKDILRLNHMDCLVDFVYFDCEEYRK
jgi:hypothetical protein